MSGEIKNVLFDLDGTLADTAPDLAFALNCLLEEQGQEPLNLETIRPSVSLGGVAMIKLAFNIEETDPGFDVLRNRFLEIYRDNIANQTVLFEGMDALLNKLEENKKPWGVVTNKSTWLTEPLMQELKLDKRTNCIVCGDTLPVNKPHPAPLLHACELLSCDAADSVYIGDAKRDIEAGIAAGMKTLVAAYGYVDANDNIESWGADAIVDNVDEITAWLTLN